MTKRYFYTDALAAAWMVKHFEIVCEANVKFFIPFGDSKTEIQHRIFKTADDILAFKLLNKFYIHPDSLGILKPQMGDLVRLDKSMPRYETIVMVELRDHLKQNRSYSIIRRNGIAFMWPESEDVDGDS